MNPIGNIDEKAIIYAYIECIMNQHTVMWTFTFLFPIIAFHKLWFRLFLRYIRFIRSTKDFINNITLYCISIFAFQAIDLFMSSCMIFVFLSLIEYAFVNVMMGDISDGKFLKISNKIDSFYTASYVFNLKVIYSFSILNS